MPDIRALIQPVLDHPAFRAVCSALAEGRPEVVLSGLTRTAKALVVAGLSQEFHRPVVVLTADNESAEQLCQTSSTFLNWLEPNVPAAASALPAWDCSPYEGRSPHAEIAARRAVALWNMARGSTRVLFAPLAAALARFREGLFYRSLALQLKVGDELNLEDLKEHLEGVGYEAGEPVANPGQFSRRGGIIDVFSPEAAWPFRIEFFGDQIESVREFDPLTQRSRKPVPSALILPLQETKISSRFFQSLVQVLAGSDPKQRNRDSEPDWAPSYSSKFPGWEFFVPLVEPHPNSLFALFEPPLLVWDEPLERTQQLDRTLEEWKARFDEVRDTAPPRPQPETLLHTKPEFLISVAGLPQLALKELPIERSEGGAALSPRTEFVLSAQPPPKYHGAIKEMIEDVRSRAARGETVTFVLPTIGKADRVREILKEYEVPFENATETPTAKNPEPKWQPGECKDPQSPRQSGLPPSSGMALIARGELREGLVVPDRCLALLSDSDVFGEFVWGTTARREGSRAASFLSDLSDLKVGDYVVHVDHGIGLYQGLRQLEVESRRRDFMLLTYQEDAKLYVPLERLDLIEKYRGGGDGVKPQLDRLGGASWARTKARVKRALRDMAEELLQLYAERKMHGGIATSPDTPWQKEFQDAFEFEETPDQLSAADEIRMDLESPQPMDRLLCGDVGYGKTELAMRAAFKVVQDSRQVAVLAPTTVLAFQHLTTFRQRMAPFPVQVEMLSRFRSGAEQKRILAETEAGKVDILIGTHRLLSKDLRFRDLGLLIVDEEQRFGVAAKEKLKRLRANVDVLTMSATPIPRTLHMALGGLRDLSVIETPPQGRLAIQTLVAPFSEALIQSAILQEMARQGQIYFVHNRVESIFSLAALVQRLVPSARIGVAHGQMHERELEKAMLKFIEGEYDVLVSTALIENGLDIPRANTMIVNHADRFGLADLYQLRGRIGRSNRRAYAYFLIRAEGSLTPTAKRRLAALKEFSDLGAGFRLAALDLELRGAGNLLGAEQSGHVSAIGIDLYLKMLEQTVEELKGAPAAPEVRTTLNLGLDIKIPDSYIADESQRLRMYKRISSLATPEEGAGLEVELLDRYGPIPASVTNLLRYARLKSEAERFLVQSIERRAEEIWMRFHPQAPVEPEKLTRFVRRHPQAAFRPDGLLRFRLAARNGDLIEQIQNALRQLHG